MDRAAGGTREALTASPPRAQETIDSTKAKLEQMLRADKWLTGTIAHVAVTGRTKSIYSTWKKMNRHGCGVGRVHDLMALRVVLDRGPHARAEPASDADEMALCYQEIQPRLNRDETEIKSRLNRD